MDLSRPVADHLPTSRSGVPSLWRSLLLLTFAVGVAVAVGIAGVLVVRLAVPNASPAVGLVFGVAGLLVTLVALLRVYRLIVPWYYLLPAILFLLTFTFFPVVLTVILAFTDYSGVRSGGLNLASETAVTSVDGTALTIADPRTFDCADLRNGCSGVRAQLFGSGLLEVPAESLEGNVLTLAEPLPEGRSVQQVGIFLTAVGDRFQFPVASVEGREITLERAPDPSVVDLTEVGLQLDRSAITRTMEADDGDRITLTEALPEGFAPEGIARYNDFGYVGLANFDAILRQARSALLPVFVWNVLFAVTTVVVNTVVGTFLAVLLNNRNLRLRALYRTLLILPWALPNIITIQVWKGFLNQNFGAINRMLMLLDITPEPINWLLGSEWPARAAVVLVNLWLGYPFMMVAVLGALSAIPDDLYEAARIDGASAVQQFWQITAPLLRTALVPITLTGFAFNFNNFNIIFLLTDGGPPVSWGTATARGTDILISWAYNTAFRSQGSFAYGLGSAISILIFVITLAVSLINFRVTGALKEEAR